MQLRARRILTPLGIRGPAEVEMDGGRVIRLRPVSGPTPDILIAPGFIDLQVNGHQDVDVGEAEGQDWARLDQMLLGQGVTGWLPTLVSREMGLYPSALARLAAAAHERPAPGPAALGVHLEGPFLTVAGAHDPSVLVPADAGFVEDLPATVRMVTMAPEGEENLAAVGALARKGAVVALGHSRATWSEATAAAAAGASVVTHLYNAMPPLHHREPGLAGAALSDPRLVPTIIADGVHVHPASLLSAFRARRGLCGPGHPGLVLVTDAIAWRSGRWSGRAVVRRDGDAPRLGDGTIAGSALTMDAAVRTSLAAGVDLASALLAATRAPAAVLGLADRGHLVSGARADLVVLDQALEVAQTWVGGRLVWSA
jgi:N-acetylglucosamine-6-phosphate deacetylase